MNISIAEYFGRMRDRRSGANGSGAGSNSLSNATIDSGASRAVARLRANAAGRVCLVAGTRPEIIKLAPVYHALKAGPLDVTFVTTGQHKDMANQALAAFEIVPDAQLSCLEGATSLPQIQSRLMVALEKQFVENQPDLVVTQGDTSTAMIGALTAFSMGISIAHVEAGLSSGSKFDPFPEEMFRTIIRQMADFHFAPTHGARENLINSGISPDLAFMTGNTVVDAVEGIAATHLKKPRVLDGIADEKRIVLVTTHRRESWGPGISSICRAVRRLAEDFSDVEFVWPVHLNPKVAGPIHRMMADVPSVHLIEPLGYLDFVAVLARADLAMTDSGGIQEEAPSFDVPTLVMRDVTERPEAVEAGLAKLVGKDEDTIIQNARLLLSVAGSSETKKKMVNPFGDGLAGPRIAGLIEQAFGKARAANAAE